MVGCLGWGVRPGCSSSKWPALTAQLLLREPESLLMLVDLLPRTTLPCS